MPFICAAAHATRFCAKKHTRNPYMRPPAYAPRCIISILSHFSAKNSATKKQPAVFTPRAAIFFRLFDDIDKIIVRSGEKEKHDDQSEQSEENDLENKIPLGHRFQTDHGN